MNIEHFTLPIVSAEQVSGLWNENDVLIFIIDLKDYPLVGPGYLDETEKAHLDTLKTEYFKKRYIVSRLVLKSLSGILKEKSWSDMITCKDEYGKVHVCGHYDLHVCISYTENIVALALSRIDVGIDIEVIRSRSFTSISKSIDTSLPDATLSKDGSGFLFMWTLKEAYCKFSNETMFSNLRRRPDMSGVYHSGYVIDNKYVLALITKLHPPKVQMFQLQKIDFLS